MIIWIDVENSSGTKLGDGPIVPISWEYTDPLDRAGKFKTSIAASDPKAALIVSKRRLRCWGILNDVLTDMGAGIIDNIKVRAGADGKVLLDISGDNLMRELMDRQVGSLIIDDGAGGPDTSGPADIIAFAPAGWSLDTVNGYSSTLKAIQHTFEGESVLAALVRLAELTGEHFRLGSGRKIVWMRNDQADSGIRGVQYIDPMSIDDAPDSCIILDVENVEDSFGLVTRVYAYGIGEGNQRIDLIGLTGWSKTGYTLDNVNNYIKRDSAETTYGQVERYMSWKDIDNQTTLAELVYEYLKRNSDPYESYKLSLAALRQRIAPGSTMRVDYHRWVDGYHAINIADDILVLESTLQIDANGIHTTSLQIATIDRWPVNDSSMVVSKSNNSQNFYTHDQKITSTVLPHNTTHQSGGTDPIKLDDLAAADDNTDLNASSTKHGLLPKLTGTAEDVLHGDGTIGGKSVRVDSTEFFYLGAIATDGSWRIARSGNDLLFQRRESGSWVTKGTVSA